jgi:hypothetical protein
MDGHGGGDPVDLAAWGLHCYCPTARRTPHAVIAEGSNGQLLYEARGGGVTRQTLHARGVPVTDKQVTQLSEFGLLHIDGEVLRTAFPVLGRAESTALRRQVRPLGELLAGQLATQVGAVRRQLDRMDLGDSTYAIVFGYALDGLFWDRLACRGAVPDTTLSRARPWWNGAFWAVYPARDSAAGTNFVDCGTATLVQVWTTATVARLAALATAAQLPDVVRGLVDTTGAVSSSEVIDATGVTWRLRRPNGRPAIPVVGINGPLDQIASQLADAVADALAGNDAAGARAIVPCDDVAIATAVVAHELIWDITEGLIADRALAPPASLMASRTGDEAPTELLFASVHNAAAP